LERIKWCGIINLESNLLYWLFVLFGKYDDPSVKEKIAMILIVFHSSYHEYFSKTLGPSYTDWNFENLLFKTSTSEVVIDNLDHPYP
jgi:hypothetical protein